MSPTRHPALRRRAQDGAEQYMNRREVVSSIVANAGEYLDVSQIAS